jgi:hypothetical protein
VISDKTFIQYAISAYHNPQCSTLEQFNADVKKFSGIKRLMNGETDDLEFTKVVLNNIVYLYNIFDYEACTKMLFFKVREEQWFKLKTFLVFLNRMPDNISELHLINTEIKICQNIANHLRSI